MARSWEKNSNWQGAQKWGGQIDFTATYGVELDSREDGPQAAAAAPGIPMLGSTYAFGNDVDPLAFAKNVTPAHVEGRTWDVVIVFGPIEPEQSEGTPKGLNDAGEPVTNPLDEAPYFTFSPMYTTRAVSKGIYRGVYNRDGALDRDNDLVTGRPLNSNGPVINSAGHPFDPPLEQDYFRLVARLTRNEVDYLPQLYGSFHNTVNSVAITIHTALAQLVLQPYEGKMVAITGRPQRRNGVNYMRVEYEMHIDRNGWRRDVLDRGFHAKAEQGQPNPTGDPLDYAPVAGQAVTRTLLDVNGEALQEPALFDGFGQPFTIDPPFGIDEKFIRYSVETETDWAPLNLPTPP